MHLFFVGLGGFLGTVLRYWLSGAAQRWLSVDFPIGTLVVNVLGCFVVGAFWSLVEYREWFGPEQRVFVTVGILGGFTTFSAFGYETFVLLRDREYLFAAINILGNMVLGFAAVTFGWTMAKAMA